MNINYRIRLRNDTALKHQEVDDLFSELDISKRQDYSVFLNANFIALKAIENHFSSLKCKFDVPPIQSNLLYQDICNLGEEANITQDIDLPGLPSSLGMAYVVSGAHFGSSVLLKRVSASNDAKVLSARSYLQSNDMKRYWPIVMQQIKQTIRTEADYHVLVKGALTAFNIYFDSFNLIKQENLSV